MRATGAFETIDHPTAGSFETVAAPFRMPLNDEVGVRGPAPELGEHSKSLLSELLGFSDAEIEELAAKGVVPPTSN